MDFFIVMSNFFSKKRKFIFIALLACFIFFSGIFFNKETVRAQELSEDIAIAAIVDMWFYFEILPVLADLEPALVEADGSLNIGTTPDIVLRVGTNNNNGWEIKIRGRNNGLRSSATDHTINSVSNFSLLTAGTDGYGMNATGTLEGVLVEEIYDHYGTDTVGELIDNYNLLASRNSLNMTSDVLRIQIKAAASIMTPVGEDYLDIITITLSPII